VTGPPALVRVELTLEEARALYFSRPSVRNENHGPHIRATAKVCKAMETPVCLPGREAAMSGSEQALERAEPRSLRESGSRSARPVTLPPAGCLQRFGHVSRAC
jgi:hypothetical protein